MIMLANGDYTIGNLTGNEYKLITNAKYFFMIASTMSLKIEISPSQ